MAETHHVITVSPSGPESDYDVRYMITCSAGCNLGTSAIQSDFLRAMDRARTHRHVVNLRGDDAEILARQDGGA